MKSTKNKMAVRLITYFAGLFIMTAGIAVSVKSDLGVSPVSSIPYTITCIWGIEMGNATILLHIGLVILQILLLRRNFNWINLLQILVGIVFGKFTTLCNTLVGFLPATDNLAIRLVMSLASAALIAIGIFFYMPANIMPLAGEGATQAVARVTHRPFAQIKVFFDSGMVALSLAACLIALHSFGSVGVGTVIAAFLVGTILGQINKRFGAWRDKLLGA